MGDRRAWARVLTFAAGYVLVGVATAYLAASAPSIPARKLWRLAGWGFSLGLFLAQLYQERIRLARTTLSGAWHTATAVVLGALALAAVGPVRAHWGTETQARALLSLILWPVMAGVPAFIAGVSVGALIGRVRRRA
jgi:hypothetical protein